MPHFTASLGRRQEATPLFFTAFDTPSGNCLLEETLLRKQDNKELESRGESRVSSFGMAILSDFCGLIQECVVLFIKEQPVLFAGAIVLGMASGGGLWLGCHFWAHLWNKSYKMTLGQHAIAGIALALAVLISVVCFSVKEMSSIVESQIQHWQETISGDGELKSRLMQELYEKISSKGLENMAGIPDPATLEQGKRWEFAYHKQETQLLIGQVYTQGTLAAFAETHRLLFTALFLGMASDLVASEVRMKTNASPSRTYDMEDAACLVATEITEKLQGRIGSGVLVIRVVLPIVLFAWMWVPIVFIAMAAYRDINVRTLQSD